MRIYIISFCILLSSAVSGQFPIWSLLGGPPIGGAYTFCQSSDSTKLYMGNNSGILRSLDSGNTWYNIYPVSGGTGSGIQSVLMRNDTLYGDFSGCSLQGVRYSADDGITWARIDSGIGTSYDMAANNTSIYVAAYDFIYYTHNNGASWQIINTPHLPTGGAFSAAVKGDTVYVGGNGMVHISTNNGTSWTTHPINAGIIWSACISGNRIFAGTNGAMFRSDNLGNTWTQCAWGQDILAIKRFGKYGFAGTSSGGNLVMFSTDSGTWWSYANTGLLNATIWDFAYTGTHVICSSVSNLWQTPFSLATADNEINNTSFNLTPFPNPARNKVTIDAQGMEEISVVKMYSSTGRLVLDEAQKFNSLIELDVSSLPAGMYYVQLVGAQTTALQKIVIMQ